MVAVIVLGRWSKRWASFGILTLASAIYATEMKAIVGENHGRLFLTLEVKCDETELSGGPHV